MFVLKSCVLLLLLPVLTQALEGCKITKKGQEYNGTLATTISGLTCQRWDSQSPQTHTLNKDTDFPNDGTVAAAKNYCRNPDGEALGPWCYTTTAATRWEYCYVEACPKVCKTSTLGQEYVGTVATTKTGLECQDWTNQSPHKHIFKTDGLFPEGSITAASNYCRNPDGEHLGPWCYTTTAATRWLYCDVQLCPTCKTTALGQEYTGTLSKTSGGLMCQSWSSQSPHTHIFGDSDSKFPDGSVAAAANYCRNPDGESEGPWCYTTDKDTRWKYCSVPSC